MSCPAEFRRPVCIAEDDPVGFAEFFNTGMPFAYV
jgi:hypothetical protein